MLHVSSAGLWGPAVWPSTRLDAAVKVCVGEINVSFSGLQGKQIPCHNVMGLIQSAEGYEQRLSFSKKKGRC